MGWVLAAGSTAQPSRHEATLPPTPVAILPDRYIVVFRPEALQNADRMGITRLAETLVAAWDGDLLYTYDVALQGFAAVLSAEAAQALAAHPAVAYVEPDQVVYALGTQSPAPWGLDRVDQRTLPLNNTYTYETTALGVHVYIFDTGIRSTHTEFDGRIGNGYTAINDGLGTADCHGHGTHVAGTVGGQTYGVAKEVTLHPVRVLSCEGQGTTSGVIAGVNWVLANHIAPAVVNMSLGGNASDALDTAIRNAINGDIVFVVAAGNNNGDACLMSPARVAEALTVGASTSADARASFSNYGGCLDLFAPGVSITSAYHTSDMAIAISSGTSMAAPHVAGAAALYRAQNPTASALTVHNAVIANATTGVLSGIGSGSPNRLL
ncbi:MAG: S8 family serine peptidase, partial [Anaerolineae bacterium]|nr:S8 family serine peptidase [Anaerolineae bacterium]